MTRYRYGHWYDQAKDAGHIPPPHGPQPEDSSSFEEYRLARDLYEWIAQAREMTPGGGDLPVDEHTQTMMRS